MSILKQLQEDLKTISLMGPSVKSVSYMLDSIAKDKSGVKKYLEIISIKGGGGGGGPTPNEKIHLKFPF